MTDATTAKPGTDTTSATTTETTTADTGKTTETAATTLADGKTATTETTAATTTETTAATTTETTATPDWRARLAGEDKTFLKTLDRYASEADFGKAHRALHQKLSSGEYKRDLPENATDEEKGAWRKERGVPDKVEGYEVKLPDGLVLGESDAPVVDLFKAFAHGKNYTPQQFNEALGWYYETQDALASQRSDADATFKTKAEDELRAEYGNDYRRNMNVLGTVRDSMPEGLAANLLAGRLADGTKIGDSPAVIRWMVQQGLEINPAGTLLPSSGGDHGKTVTARLEEIRVFRRENPDKYDQDKKLQAEELQLLDAQTKLKAHAA